jgi:hypothetical protein
MGFVQRMGERPLDLVVSFERKCARNWQLATGNWQLASGKWQAAATCDS